MIDLRLIARHRAKYAAARQRLDSAEKRQEETFNHNCAAAKAREFVNSAALAVQTRVHNVIAGLVTRCLHAVFEDRPYTFKIEFVRRRNKTEADLYFERDGHRYDYSQVGGGVLDVAAFALKLSSLVLRRPALRKVIIADEPFKFLSERGGNIDRIRDLLLTLAKETGFQFVLVTHNQKLEIGKVVRL